MAAGGSVEPFWAMWVDMGRALGAAAARACPCRPLACSDADAPCCFRSYQQHMHADVQAMLKPWRVGSLAGYKSRGVRAGGRGVRAGGAADSHTSLPAAHAA